MREVLVVEGVYKTYPGGVRALNGVTLTVRKGELVGLVGANGSGKTTLIKVSLGILSRDKGVVLLNGEDPIISPSAREGVGVVFERPNLPSGMSVKRLLEAAARLYGVPREYVDEAIALAGLRGHEDKSFLQLSAGLKQRAAIAHALIAQPDFIIADEPTSNLDPVERVRILEVLSKLNAKGITLLITSHVIHEVVRTASRIIVMRQGRVVRDGDVGEVLSTGRVRVRARRPEILKRVLEERGFEYTELGASVYVKAGGGVRSLLEALLDAERMGAGIVSFDAAEPGIEEVLS